MYLTDMLKNRVVTHTNSNFRTEYLTDQFRKKLKNCQTYICNGKFHSKQKHTSPKNMKSQGDISFSLSGSF